MAAGPISLKFGMETLQWNSKEDMEDIKIKQKQKHYVSYLFTGNQ